MRYFNASRAASIAASKQCDGERGATIGSGASPWRPNIASSRSVCSVLVGMPVDGPARCTSTISIGSSRLIASPSASALRSRPGPEVPVAASAPENAAPIAIDAAAISSSACMVRTSKLLRRLSSWRMSDAGVIG